MRLRDLWTAIGPFGQIPGPLGGKGFDRPFGVSRGSTSAATANLEFTVHGVEPVCSSIRAVAPYRTISPICRGFKNAFYQKETTRGTSD